MKATKIQYREFSSSFVWEDLKTILKERLKDIRDQLERATSGDPAQEMHRIAQNRGRAEELRYLLELPGFIIENFESLAEYDKAVSQMTEGGEEDA